MIPQIYLRKGKEESLLRRHPWIFSGAIDHIKAEEESDFAEGALVEVYTRQGEFMALGHYQVGSIAVRVLTFEREEIDQAWWNLRIAVAYDVRRTLDLTDNPATTCYRLVHGEGDSLPGLVVDIYGPVAVIQCHSAGMYHARMQIAEALRTVYGARLTAIYDKSSQTLPFKAALGAVDGYCGEPRTMRRTSFWKTASGSASTGKRDRKRASSSTSAKTASWSNATPRAAPYSTPSATRAGSRSTPSRAAPGKSARWTLPNAPWRWPRRTCSSTSATMRPTRRSPPTRWTT